MPRAESHVLVTGVTGFLGKVVLEALVRRADELGVTRIYLLIRPKRDRTPQERFTSEVVASDCFRLLPEQWEKRCTVVLGNVTEPDLALSAVDEDILIEHVTHIINCAACVDFDRPLEEATSSNVTGALNVLAFAKRCSALRSMVHVSTAYVWPGRLAAQPCDESLVPLPFEADAVYADIIADRANRDDLLRQTGHANTYTLTKCLAEHLLIARQGAVPVRIVRPSVISTCRLHPFPGWVDSTSGFTGFVTLYGRGFLRVLGCDAGARPDIVPCDEVADRVLRSAFEPDRTKPIEHAVAGLQRSSTIRDITDGAERYFARYPAGGRARWRFIGKWGWRAIVREFLHTTIPLFLARAYFSAIGRATDAQSIRRVQSVLWYMNRGFRSFTHTTFDFRVADAASMPGFDPREYHATICAGVRRHLLKHSVDEMPFAGRRHAGQGGDLRWALRQPRMSAALRVGGFVLSKMWRRCTDLVTFDEAAFERARAMAKPDELVVIVPTHRSYFDFLAVPYLFFARPDLGIDIPHIAATEDFARIPVVGTLLRSARVFFIRRGVGTADPELTRRVSELAAGGHTLKFFVEGTRSRSRRTLPPRRGLLRALQSTGKRCVILPVAVSYDRIPEEAALARELAGARKEPHRLSDILRWMLRLWRGHIRLGRIHVSCGSPLHLDSSTDVPALSRAIVGELQAATVISTFHLRVFLSRCPVHGFDLTRLRDAVRHRGGVVLESSLPIPAPVDDTLHECLLNQWIWLFYRDLAEIAETNPALRDHIEQCAWASRPQRVTAAPGALAGLLEALFSPICRRYAEVARHVAEATTPGEHLLVSAVADALPHVFRPDVELALQDMARHEILSRQHDGFRWNGRRDAVLSYAQACEWRAPVVGGTFPSTIQSSAAYA